MNGVLHRSATTTKKDKRLVNSSTDGKKKGMKAARQLVYKKDVRCQTLQGKGKRTGNGELQTRDSNEASAL